MSSATKLWEQISANSTPGTTPILSRFWKLLPPGAVVLEVGCAWGRIVFKCIEKKIKVYGIDINNNEVNSLRSKLEDNGFSDNAKISHQSILETYFSNDFFDGAIMQGLLGALSKGDRVKALKELHRILKKNAPLHIAEFEVMTDEKSRKRYQDDLQITGELGTLSVKNSEGAEIYRTHNFILEELTGIFINAGFTIKTIKRQKFVSYHGNIKPGILLIAIK